MSIAKIIDIVITYQKYQSFDMTSLSEASNNDSYSGQLHIEQCMPYPWTM